MDLKGLFSFNHIFSLLCILGTIWLGVDCLRKFLADEDISQTDYVKYHHDDLAKNIYPAFSFCIINPFMENTFEKYNHDINVTSYSYFLQGLLWNDEMLQIDYDDVTVSLEKSLISITMILQERGSDGKRIKKQYLHNENQIDQFEWKPKFYISFRSSIRKCFTYHIPIIEQHLVYHYRIKIRNSIFPKGVRPVPRKFDGSNPNDGGAFSIYFHYPGQRFTSYHTNMDDWISREKNSDPYIMIFTIEDVEVIRFRNKNKRTCIENWTQFDQIVMKDIMSKANCHPPHWNTTQTVTLCSKKEQMKHFKDQPKIGDIEKYDHPCHMIKTLRYGYHERLAGKKMSKGNLIFICQHTLR